MSTLEQKELAIKLVTFIKENMWKESVFSSPRPAVNMSDPYGLLKIIEDNMGITADEIDAIFVADNEKRKAQQ